MPSGSPVHVLAPWPASFPSVTCVWLEVLRHVFLNDHFLMTIWNTPDLSNNLCFCLLLFSEVCSFHSLICFLQNCSSSLGLKNLYLSSALLRMDWPIYAVPRLSISKVLSEEFGMLLISTFHTYR